MALSDTEKNIEIKNKTDSESAIKNIEKFPKTKSIEDEMKFKY